MKRYKGAFESKTDVGKVRIANEDQAASLTNSQGEVFLLVCDSITKPTGTSVTTIWGPLAAWL